MIWDQKSALLGIMGMFEAKYSDGRRMMVADVTRDVRCTRVTVCMKVFVRRVRLQRVAIDKARSAIPMLFT